MKIRKVHVRNFRSLRDFTVYPGDVMALVGRNNSGKSNLLRALELFFRGTTTLVCEDFFYKKHTDDPIEITITFGDLSAWEMDDKQFGPWMDGDTLTIGRQVVCDGENSFTVNNVAIQQAPQVEWLNPETITGEALAGWWARKDELKVNGLDFGAVLGTKKPKVGEWKDAAATFVKRNRGSVPMQTVRRENPKGYPGVLKGALPEFIYVQAVRDFADEARVAKTNPFGQLVNSILQKVSDAHKLEIATELASLQERLNRSGGPGRLQEIADLEKRLNVLMGELMECDVELEMAMPKLHEVFSGARVLANDGERTPVEVKGHGLQRAMIFTIMRAYAELANAQKAPDRANERSTVFAIEEPELYLHPQSQRTLASVIRRIASTRDQVIYSTHSSLFVDLAHFDDICIVRRDKDNIGHFSTSKQLPMQAMLDDLKIRKGVDATVEGMREQYSHAFNQAINEGFFADRVIVVEGPSEQYALPEYARAMGFDLDRNNVSVVHANGKGQMDRLLRVFSGFGLPVFVWFDGDKDKEDAAVKAKSRELLELLGDPIDDVARLNTKVTDRYAVLETDFDDYSKKEIPSYLELAARANGELGPTGKPLIHRYVARHLANRVVAGEAPNDVIPETIRDIVQRVQTLKHSGNVLRTRNNGQREQPPPADVG